MHDIRRRQGICSERITGVPVAVLRTPYIERMGLRANAFERWMLRGHRRKHWMRTWFATQAALNLKKSAFDAKAEFWQAGRSVAAIDSVLPAGDIVRECAQAARSIP